MYESINFENFECNIMTLNSCQMSDDNTKILLSIQPFWPKGKYEITAESFFNFIKNKLNGVECELVSRDCVDSYFSVEIDTYNVLFEELIKRWLYEYDMMIQLKIYSVPSQEVVSERVNVSWYKDMMCPISMLEFDVKHESDVQEVIKIINANIGVVRSINPLVFVTDRKFVLFCSSRHTNMMFEHIITSVEKKMK